MTNSNSDPLILKMKGVSKSFGNTRALSQVDFDLQEGEVHALIGENGAGKSTLVKILSGAIKQDEGEVFFDGSPFSPSSPLESRWKGISMIYQELNLAPHLTVVENIMLGKERSRGPFLDRKQMKQVVHDALGLVHHQEVDLDIPVKNLSIGLKQIVEIARALADNAKILIMDEPTSSLSLEDTERLFEIVRKLKGRGVSIIYISHFLEEVQKVADRFSVLRDGKKVQTGRIQDASLEEIIQMMVGQKLVDMYPKVPHEVGKALLRLIGFKGKSMPSELNLSLHRGEILGFAGLVGAGRTDVLRAIFGLEGVERGTLAVKDRRASFLPPRMRILQGLGFLSEDRQKEGLALSQSIADNVALSHFSPYSSFGFLNLKKFRLAIDGYLAKMKIKAVDAGQPVVSLSGGNQQKVALARLLHQEAEILLLDEPTRGIDVVSKTQVYEWMGRQAALGNAIIFVSSYLPELLGVCDNIAVFHRGRLVDLRPALSWDPQAILTAATLGRAA